MTLPTVENSSKYDKRSERKLIRDAVKTYNNIKGARGICAKYWSLPECDNNVSNVFQMPGLYLNFIKPCGKIWYGLMKPSRTFFGDNFERYVWCKNNQRIPCPWWSMVVAVLCEDNASLPLGQKLLNIIGNRIMDSSKYLCILAQKRQDC